jgi:putative molybdopterin biosynthesis protein
MKSLEEARAILLKRFQEIKPPGVERIAVQKAKGRITGEPLFARFSSPHFHSAAMDGIAVKAEDTFGATVENPKILEINREAWFINTGQKLPEKTNAVIMIEEVRVLKEGTRVELLKAAYPWQHVRKVGEDIVATELILTQNTRLSPYDLAALASAGIFEVPVWCRPRVLILPTGSELIRGEEIQGPDLPPGKTVESNSILLSALVESYGGEARILPLVPDEAALIQSTVQSAMDTPAELLLINAGSSAGSEDYTANIIGEMGEVLVHGVTMMPGKPTILGVIGRRPVLGIPGYAVSAAMAMEQFVKPLIFRMLGQPDRHPPRITAYPTRDIPSKLGTEDFLRVQLGLVGEKMMATPLQRGAGSITSLTRADGILRIPSVVEGVEKDRPVEVELLRDLEELQNTLVIVGSHDNTLDLLTDQVRREFPRIRISSSNVGSLGGILAIRDGKCHLAGSHLLDPATGEYNISYIRRYLSAKPVRLINLVYREQGLILPPENPKGIQGLKDLLGEDVTLINRQPGSGTRVLLDFRLKELGLDPQKIKGYPDHEFTHMAVAVNVLSGRAEVGLGIRAAARALGLSFVPVVKERYDLIVPEEVFQSDRFQAVLSVIRSRAFQEAVLALGGYDTSETGKIVFPLCQN